MAALQHLSPPRPSCIRHLHPSSHFSAASRGRCVVLGLPLVMHPPPSLVSPPPDCLLVCLNPNVYLEV